MKVMTVLGTRPEIIRLSRVIPALDDVCQHVLVHTGQNFARSLKDVFFTELGVRAPDHAFSCDPSPMMAQVGRILAEVERLIAAERPDRVLILGDTNSGLSALAAKRMGIPVFHLEAGNRCFDDRVPEEVNRRIIDHASDVLMPYTERSRSNLLREGIPAHRVFVVGNPIREVLDHHAAAIDGSEVLERLGVEPHRYAVVTAHRAENVDDPARLALLVQAVHHVRALLHVPILCSLHPRTRSRLEAEGRTLAGEGVVVMEPLGLFDFVKLEKNALCVLTDSGTVQEECCLFGVPNVTLRDVTERPETIEVGSNVLASVDPERVSAAVEAVLRLPRDWTPPAEYLARNVSRAVAKIVLGYLDGQR